MRLPWMPFNCGDYKRDTSHLSIAEHGAYLHLIMHYWEHGGLPAEENMIRRIAKMSPAEWAESRDVLAALFRDGWRHKRIDQEREKAIGISEKRAEAARNKGKPRQPESDPPPAPDEQMHSNCSTSDEQEHSTVAANVVQLHTHVTSKHVTGRQEGEESPPQKGLSSLPVNIVTENAREVFVEFATPQWDAWARHDRARGKIPSDPRYDKRRGRNGMLRPSEFPPATENLTA